jgi:hypothetical protein
MRMRLGLCTTLMMSVGTIAHAQSAAPPVHYPSAERQIAAAVTPLPRAAAEGSESSRLQRIRKARRVAKWDERHDLRRR